MRVGIESWDEGLLLGLCDELTIALTTETVEVFSGFFTEEIERCFTMYIINHVILPTSSLLFVMYLWRVRLSRARSVGVIVLVARGESL